MKKLLFSVTMFCLVLLGVSCDKDEKMLFGAKETTGILTVHSISYGNHEAIEGVSVEIIGASGVQETDKGGITKFELKVGDYEVKVSKDGYLAYKKKVSIGVNNGESDLPIVGNVIEDFEMYPLTASFKGNVIINRQDNANYAGNAVVVAKAKDIDFISPMTTTTTTNGTYSFTVVPEGLALELEAYLIENGIAYKGAGNVAPLKEKQEATARTIVLNSEENVFDKDIVIEPQTITDKLTVFFNMPVEVIEVNVKANGLPIYVKEDLRNEKRQLSVCPKNIDSEETDYWWKSTTYSYDIKVKNSSGKLLNIVDEFRIMQYGQITPIQASYSNYILTWTKQENASCYEIYASQQETGSYTLITTVTDNFYQDISNLFFLIYDYVKVIGVNDQMKGNLDSTPATYIY